VVRAPAGYGKSTFAAQWCQTDERNAAWIRMDQADNDPVHLLWRLTMALDEIHTADPGLSEAIHLPGAELDAVLVPRFLHSLAARAPFLLVLDDLHLVTSTRATTMVRALLRFVPDRSQVVVTTRGATPTGLAKLRASGEAHELDAVDLAFDEREGQELFTRAGLQVEAATAHDLTQITEGWAAGLMLAALSLRSQRRTGDATPVSGTSRNIAGYFREEVLDPLSEDDRRFLLMTSPLQRLSGPVCEAVTGREESARILESMGTTNLFLVPLDAQGEWFRYHHLFQDLLEAELERSDGPGKQTVLERAAQWHEDRGDPGEAFEYARLGGDFDRAGRVLLRHWDSYLGSGRLETLLQWLRGCTEQGICSDPQLALAAGWICGFASMPERTRRYLAAAEQFPLDGPSSDGATTLHASMLNLRASVSDSATTMLEDGLALVASELPTQSRRLIGGYRNVAVANLVMGHCRDAITACTQAAVLAEPIPEARYVRVMCLGFLALAHLDRGEWEDAAAATRTGEQHMDGFDNTLQQLPVVLARAALLARSNDPRALGLVEKAHSLTNRALASPCLLAYLTLRLAEIAHAAGAETIARSVLFEVDLTCQRLQDPGCVPERARDVRRRMTAVDPALALLTPAENRVLRQLATHRTLQEIAGHLFVSRSTIKTHVASIYSKLAVTSRAEAVAMLGEAALDTSDGVEAPA
jgi:LuxR family maltose regulon positive regulatory protein